MKDNDEMFLKCTSALLDALNYPQISLTTAKESTNPDSIQTIIFNELSDLHLKPKFKQVTTKNRLKPPCILLRKKTHPIVLLNKTDTKIIIYNPKTFKIEELEDITSLETELHFEKISNKEKMLSTTTKNWTFHLVKKFSLIFMQASALCTITNLLTMLTPIFILMIFSQINNQGVPPNITYIFIGVIIYILASFIFTVVKSYTLSFIGARLNFLISTEYFKRILTLSNNQPYNITLTKQIQQFMKIASISDNLGNEILERVFDIFYLLTMILTIYFLAGNLAAIPLITFFIFLFACIAYVPFTKKVNSQQSQTRLSVNEFLRESVANLATIKATSSEDEWMKKGKMILFEKISNNEQKSIYKNLSVSLSYSAVQIATLATIFVGVDKVINKEIDVPVLMGCVFFLWKALTPLKSIIILAQKIKDAHETTTTIDQFMNLETEEDNLQLRPSILSIKSVTLKNVTAKYQGGKRFALRGASLSLNKGETTLILGKDGSGKNSIVRIILGILQPQMGNVFINDFNQTQYNQRELRRSISISPPAKIPFNLTIKNMFELYNDQLEKKDLIFILKEFCISKAKKNFDIPIEEWDTPLSTCELKRLSIALTLVKKSSIYILKDITNGLSLEGQEIIKRILEKKRHKTTIVITSSDKSLYDISDKLIYLKEGKVEYTGNPKSFFTNISKRNAV